MSVFSYGGGRALAQDLPAFNKPNSLVYDTENGSEDKFMYLITATDYAHDGKVMAEIWGYGGKEAEEWVSLGEIALSGFSDSYRLNTDANKYLRYRYIAIQLKAGKRKFVIRADQKKKNMNFYFWEAGTDPSVSPLPFNNDYPDAYVFDMWLIDKGHGGNIRFVNDAESPGGFECTVQGYNEKKHSWELFGECRANQGEYTWLKQRKLSYNLKDFRYYSVDVFTSGGEKSTSDVSFFLTKEIGGQCIAVKDKPESSSGDDDVEELRRQIEELKKQLGQ